MMWTFHIFAVNLILIGNSNLFVIARDVNALWHCGLDSFSYYLCLADYVGYNVLPGTKRKMVLVAFGF